MAAFEARVRDGASPKCVKLQTGRRHRHRQRRRVEQARLLHLRQGPLHRLRGRGTRRSDASRDMARLPGVRRRTAPAPASPSRRGPSATAPSPGRTSTPSSATSTTSRPPPGSGATEVFMTAVSPGAGRALPGQHLLQVGRGVPLGPRQRPQGRVQGDHRRRLHPPARLPRPRLRLEQPVPRPDAAPSSARSSTCTSRCSTPRPRTSPPTACACTSAGATTKARTTTTSR